MHVRLFCVVVAVVLLRCASETDSPDQPPATGVGGSTSFENCYRCHGDEANGNSAPPPAAWQDTDVLDPHQQHLQGSAWRAWIDCDSCHVVPQSVSDEGHNDGLPAEITWSGLAVADDGSPQYDPTTHTCTGAYCHGATLFGGSALPQPVWTPDSSHGQCGTACHANPPALPHVQTGSCHDCHGDVVDEQDQIQAAVLHVDGLVQVDEMECNRCHGGGNDPNDPINWAPPADVNGNTDTTYRGVGAHREHLRASTLRAPIECGDCHVVPATILDAGHLGTDLPAELTWSALATADGASPSFDGTTCSDTYCHGSTLVPGGSNTTPDWTLVDGSQAACGTCHGTPPDVPLHPYSADPSECGPCHAYVGHDPVDHTSHVDGVVDVTEPLACNLCHGSAANDAPPIDVSGNVDTTFPGVGAHQRHLQAGAFSVPIACDECHVVPADWKDAGHMDTTVPAELTWGSLASADGASPSYSAGHCTNTYCHGATLGPGGTNTTPDWTTVDGSQAACGTCHGVPPDNPPHPFVPNPNDCAPCHDYVGLIPNVFADHVNGAVEIEPLPCNACHGNAVNDAPPIDTLGNSSTSVTGVGAHQSHLVDGAIANATACNECHLVPTTLAEPGHIDSALPAELTWGMLATWGGTSPSWNGVTCTATYCHRPNPSDSAASLPIPVWTVVNGTYRACDACHGYPPITATHLPDPDCDACHGQVVAADDVTIVRPDLHVDGVIQAL